MRCKIVPPSDAFRAVRRTSDLRQHRTDFASPCVIAFAVAGSRLFRDPIVLPSADATQLLDWGTRLAAALWRQEHSDPAVPASISGAPEASRKDGSSAGLSGPARDCP